MYEVIDQHSARAFGNRFRCRRKVFFVVNSSRAFLTHRATWALALQAAGADITVVSSVDHADDDMAVRALGFTFIAVDLGRETAKSYTAAFAAVRIFTILMWSRPSTVFLSATAAYVLGWPAALVLPRTRFIRVIAGAGRALASETSTGWRSRVIGLQLRFAARLRNVLTLFQTGSDYEAFHARGYAYALRSYIVKGTGIDLTTWSPTPGREKTLCTRVLFASRLFREKGVYDFVEMASNLRSREAEVDVVVVGPIDWGVNSSISESEMERWEADGILTYLGQRDDMRAVYSAADVLVFPTYHPEGTPRVLIEAAAMGLAIVCYDQRGCMEVVANGESAIVVPTGRVDVLTDEVEALLKDVPRIRELGESARYAIERSFGLDEVLGNVCALAGAERVT